MKKYYFNTGVKQYNCSKLFEGDEIINGEVNIPFYCENVPEGATLAHMCSNPNLKDNNRQIVAEVHNSRMFSKYAYFNPPYTTTV